eukprot:TRINITY_DN49040_c0_g1_i1.p1 TRINITY_DN49040_c0_g1~~TRINITY_DN49040_c0_g1_i1.p1  ORF type:complete len:319 (+),score=38.12 TRINITY_DN49040_c0_g1_i1:64-1020(+)
MQYRVARLVGALNHRHCGGSFVDVVAARRHIKLPRRVSLSQPGLGPKAPSPANSSALDALRPPQSRLSPPQPQTPATKSGLLPRPTSSKMSLSSASSPSARPRAPAARPKGAKAKEKLTNDTLVDFGEHKGKTFDEVFRTEPRYCKWVLDQISQNQSPRLLPLGFYLQQRMLQEPTSVSTQTQSPPDPPALTLPPRLYGRDQCLLGKTFVLTGGSLDVRPRVEGLVRFFGGFVRGAVSGRTDYLLVLGQELGHWNKDSVPLKRGVESSKKYTDAVQRAVPILDGFHALCELAELTTEPSADEKQFLACFCLQDDSGKL